MLRERREAVENVKAAFGDMERSAEHTVKLAALTVITMMEERAKAKLPLDTGTDALTLVAEGVGHAVKAHVAIVTAHRLLQPVPASIGVTGYGTGDCPPNEPFTGATLPPPLRVVG